MGRANHTAAHISVAIVIPAESSPVASAARAGATHIPNLVAGLLVCRLFHVLMQGHGPCSQIGSGESSPPASVLDGRKRNRRGLHLSERRSFLFLGHRPGRSPVPAGL